MIKLLNMDCMDLMAEYDDNYFDLAIVDPPYGIEMGRPGGSDWGTNTKTFHKHKDWDNEIPTKDNKYILVDTFARWKISDPLEFYKSAKNEILAIEEDTKITFLDNIGIIN